MKSRAVQVNQKKTASTYGGGKPVSLGWVLASAPAAKGMCGAELLMPDACAKMQNQPGTIKTHYVLFGLCVECM
jgi:hypothetical protein